MRVTVLAPVVAENRAGIGKSRRDKVVGLQRRGVVRFRNVVQRVARECGQVIEVAELRFGIRPERHACVFDGVVPVLVEQEDARCEAAGGLVVEMVLGSRVDRVVDERDAGFDILDHLFVDPGYRSPAVFRIQLGFGVFHIGYSEVVRVVGVVMHAEHVDQYPVGVCAADERLAFGGLELGCLVTAQFLDGRERLVGRGDRRIGIAPYRVGVFIGFDRTYFLPVVELFLKLVVTLYRTIVVDVVRRELGAHVISIVRVGRHQHLDDLFFGIQFGAAVGHLVQEIVA